MSAADFDLGRFYAALSQAKDARFVTWARVAELTGVSTTTLSRMSAGRRPDAASLAALAAWAGINLSRYSAQKGPGGLRIELSEADIRAIVREEVAAIFAKIATPTAASPAGGTGDAR